MIHHTTHPASASGFEAELRELVVQAQRAGTDVRGAYDMRTPNPNEPDYTVEITEVAKASGR